MRKWILIALIMALVFLASCALFQAGTKTVAKAVGVTTPEGDWGAGAYVVTWAGIIATLLGSGYLGGKIKSRKLSGAVEKVSSVASILSDALYKAKNNPTTKAIGEITDEVGKIATDNNVKDLMDALYSETKVKALK